MDAMKMWIRAWLESHLRGRDEFFSISESEEVVGVINQAVWTDLGNGLIKLCRFPSISCFLYEILFFLGYHAIFENIWRAKTNLIFYESVKRISGERNLRTLAGQRDQGVHVFMVEMGEKVSSQSLL
jgi:hypothetical protein